MPDAPAPMTAIVMAMLTQLGRIDRREAHPERLQRATLGIGDMHLELDRIDPRSGNGVDERMQDAEAAVVGLRDLGDDEGPPGAFVF